MLQLLSDEFALIMQSLLHTSAYIKRDTPVGNQLAEAIQVLKHSDKGRSLQRWVVVLQGQMKLFSYYIWKSQVDSLKYFRLLSVCNV